MRIEENAKAMCYNIYVDTDSEYRTMKTLMSTQSPDLKSMMKLHLNSVYGKAVTNMDKNYIIVHNPNNEVGIIFKNNIAAVVKRNVGATEILFESGYTFYSIDNYADIIKQLI